MFIIHSFFLITWSKCHNILLFITLFHFICYIVILQNTLLRVQEKFFSWSLRSHLLFSWWRKVWNVTITIYCRLITDPFPSYIFINFLFTWKFWIRIFGFPKDILLSLLILYIRNSDLAHQKRRWNNTIFKIYCVTVLSYHLFYKFLWSYLISLLLIDHHPKFHGKTSSF